MNAVPFWARTVRLLQLRVPRHSALRPTTAFEVDPTLLACIGTQTLVGDGTVVYVVFTASGRAGSRSPLRLKVTTLTGVDGQTPAIDIIDGTIDGSRDLLCQVRPPGELRRLGKAQQQWR